MTARRLRGAVAALGAVVAVLLGFTGYQALKVRHSLQLVEADLTALTGQLRAGDVSAARATVARAQVHAAAARHDSSGPVWWAGSHAPFVGRDVAAVRTVAAVSDDLAGGVLPDVVTASGRLSPDQLRPRKGRVALAPIRSAAPLVVRVGRHLETQSGRVDAIEAGRLTSPLRSPVRQLQSRLDDAAHLSDRLSRAVRLLPAMLGGSGDRTYLLLFQNNAELRATGGIPGSFAVVHARDGRVSIGRQADAGTVGRFDTPVLPLGAAEQQLFGPNLARYAQDVNFTPDFPRTARLIQAMWQRSQGQRLDGVISADPVALSYLLRGTGPVEVAGGQRLTADNAVRLLLSDVYARISVPAEQNVFFDSVAKGVFRAVASGQGKPATVLTNLATAAGQRRVLMWSDRRSEQALLAPTPIAGALPGGAGRTGAAARRPQVGVYLNDAAQSKLDFYLDYDVDVEGTTCRAGRPGLLTTVRLHSRVPASGTLPPYVVSHRAGTPPRTVTLSMLVYVPAGGRLRVAAQDGRAIAPDVLRHQGRTVARLDLAIRPGARQTLTFQMTAGVGQTGPVDLQVTPGARGQGVGTVTSPAC